jgi:ectoine hydroxylase-related dioxygenase (phytanoyl-CoA dioxygenase family)
LLYDLDFLELATLPKTRDIVRAFLGDWHQLNLQNAIINRPATVHHQSAWHRDLPYQNLVTSHPLGINVLFAIDDFSAETGGTNLLPYSHKTVTLPSSEFVARNHIVATAKAGSAIVFDVMLFHKAGANRSSIIRRAVNQLFTSPIIKQQYDFSTALLSQQEKLTDDQKRLLGFSSRVALDDKTWREERARRLKPGGM